MGSLVLLKQSQSNVCTYYLLCYLLHLQSRIRTKRSFLVQETIDRNVGYIINLIRFITILIKGTERLSDGIEFENFYSTCTHAI